MRSAVEARRSLTIWEGAVVALCPAKRGPRPARAGRHLELPEPFLEPFLWLVFWGCAPTLLYRQSSHGSLTGRSGALAGVLATRSEVLAAILYF